MGSEILLDLKDSYTKMSRQLFVLALKAGTPFFLSMLGM